MPTIDSDLNPFAPPPIGDDASGADDTSEFATKQVWDTLPAIQFGSAMAIAGGIAFLAFVAVYTFVDLVTTDQWRFESLLERTAPSAGCLILVLPGYWLLRWHQMLRKAIRGGRPSDLAMAFEAQKSFWKTCAVMVYVGLAAGIGLLFLG